MFVVLTHKGSEKLHSIPQNDHFINYFLYFTIPVLYNQINISTLLYIRTHVVIRVKKANQKLSIKFFGVSQNILYLCRGNNQTTFYISN